MTTAADFGTKIMSINAIDRDDGINAKISYFQIGEIHRTLTEGLDQLSRPPFLVDRRTGGVILNFDPQKGMKGYFDFMVRCAVHSCELGLIVRFFFCVCKGSRQRHRRIF